MSVLRKRLAMIDRASMDAPISLAIPSVGLRFHFRQNTASAAIRDQRCWLKDYLAMILVLNLMVELAGHVRQSRSVRVALSP